MLSDLKVGPKLFATVGTLLAVVSSFLPWLRAAGLDEVLNISPGTTPYLRVAVWAELVLLVAGLAVLAVGRTPALLGCAGALWFNISVLVWVFGSRTSSVLPKEVLPDNFTVRLSYGADLALLAGLMVMIGSVLILVDQTWPSRQTSATDWFVPGGVAMCVLLIIAREAIWLQLDATSFHWDLTVDAVPLLGDALLVAMLIGAVVVLLLPFVRATWLGGLGALLGVTLVLMAVIGMIAEGLVTDVADWVAGRAAFLEGQNVSIATRPGAFVVLGAGLATVAYCGTFLARGRFSDSRASRFRGANAEVLPPTSPF